MTGIEYTLKKLPKTVLILPKGERNFAKSGQTDCKQWEELGNSMGYQILLSAR